MSELRNLAAEVLQAIRKDNQRIIESIEDGSKDSQGAVSSLSDSNRKSIDLLASDISNGMTVLRSAVEEISITMKEEEKEEGSEEVVSALEEVKSAIENIETNVTVDNDFSRLEEIMNKKGDKSVVVDELKRINASIEAIDLVTPDNRDVLEQISSKIKLSDLSKIEDLLKRISEKDIVLPGEMDVVLDPNLIDDNRLRTVLPDEQVAQMSKMLDQGGANGANISNEIKKLVGFEIGDYDYIALTYVAAGNGAGEIETVTYKDGGVSGTTKAILTLAYDASNNLISVTRT